MAFRHILNYSKIATDPSNQFILNIKNSLQKHIDKGKFPSETLKYIIPNPNRPIRFCILPKIHNNLENPPGRPNMSTNS